MCTKWPLLAGRGQNESFKIEQPITEFLGRLQNEVKEHIPELMMRSQLKSNDQIFRAHAHFCGHVWRDWVTIDWGNEGELPGQMIGFVDLLGLPEDFEEDFELSAITPNVHAIVQVGECLKNNDDWELSQMLCPSRKTIGGFTNGMVSHLKLFSAPLHSFGCDCMVIPDIGGQPNDHFEPMAQKNWAECLTDWFTSRETDDSSDASTDDGDGGPGNHNEAGGESSEMTDLESEESDPTDDVESD